MHSEAIRVIRKVIEHGANSVTLPQYTGDTLVVLRRDSKEVWRGHLVGPRKPDAGPNEPGGPFLPLDAATQNTIVTEIAADCRATGTKVHYRV